MFAVIETGGKQYRVSPGTKVKIETVPSKDGSLVFDKVLFVGESNGEGVRVGSPYVSGAKVEARVIREGRAKKKIVFKYHSKTRYRKKKGHRQHFTEVEILGIK